MPADHAPRPLHAPVARHLRQGLLACLLGALGPLACAQADGLPPEVSAALQRAKLPHGALAAVVIEADSGARKLALNEQQPVNPASVFKLFTTYAALDLLGPAWRWNTPVYLTGPLAGGVLDGSVAIRGSGDPKLVIEQVWLLLRHLQQIGVREIRGDIVLDRSAMDVGQGNPGDFDGDPTRPYNVRPDALMLNYKSVIYNFSPDPARGVATVSAEPPLTGLQVDTQVPLASGACDDWRSALKAQLGDPNRVRFAGAYPASCGEKGWPVAYPDAKSFNARMVDALWREAGGRLGGTVREGTVPAGARLAFEHPSPALAEVVRDINKFSNNVMAEQLFLSLPGGARGLGAGGTVRPDEARDALRRWVAERFGEAAAKEAVIDNGSGLSRDTRVSAWLLARLLQNAWSSPVMSELMSSLPISGTDGTLRRSTATAGRAHLKTGSLRDVAAVAGYVLSNTGRRYVLVAVLNHPNANAGRPALDALVQWTIRDAPPR